MLPKPRFRRPRARKSSRNLGNNRSGRRSRRTSAPPPGETARDAVSRKNVPERSRGTRRHTCALFSGLALLFFLFSVRFGTILTSFWSPWDLKNLAFSLRRSSNSSFSLFSLRKPPESTNIIKKGHPRSPKGITEEPRSAQKRPGRPQEPPKTTPNAL